MSSVKQSAGWELRTQQVLLPKSGFEAAECEDVIGIDEQNCRFAVVDGATEAFDARNWAQRLAENWVRSDSALTAETFHEWVANEGAALHSAWNQLTLPWYAEEKARKGSFAAFVGVELDLRSDAPSWKAIALGDACLLHCRDGALLKSLPVLNSASFNSAPMLVASDPVFYKTSADSLVIDSGRCQNNDLLFLVSDAAAAWYLERFEQHDFRDILRENVEPDAAKFFENERSAGRIRNDDIAVIRLEIQQRSIS
ncbi:MAG TPA: hypothetical protein VFY67_08690 [Pyrinomonadaceae bacterium]|nr:hypothetical protein [Pyrinomonadaceae bacterium]